MGKTASPSEEQDRDQALSSALISVEILKLWEAKVNAMASGAAQTAPQHSVVKSGT